MGAETAGRSVVNISGYNVDDNVNLSDDQFDIASGATLVLLGNVTLTDDLLEGEGRVSVRGPTTIDDSLVVNFGSVQLVDMTSVTQNGGEVTGDRVIAGATWTVNSGLVEDFTNLGLLEVSGAVGSFIDRAGTISINANGVLTSQGIEQGDTNRFVDDTINGAGNLASSGTYVGSDISTSIFSMAGVRIVGDVKISSQTIDGVTAADTAFAGGCGLQVAATATLDIANPEASVSFYTVDNNGAIEAGAGVSNGAPQDFVFTGGIIGVGVVEVGPENVTLDSSAGAKQTLNFNVGDTSLTPSLILNDASEFNATISGFDKGAGADDRITLNSTSSDAPWQFQGYQSSSGALDFTNASGGTAAVHLAGTYTADDFHAVVSGGSTTITYG